ncbi:MAG TPA: hypothetical protein VFN88_03340 [Caulobacteraceae bacterium]|nr:hypothetical protein [Caulobacteraceae bacterium]
MAIRSIDPARLTGDDLVQWYQRSLQKQEQERREAAEQKHAEFVASIRANEREKDPGPENPIEALGDAFHRWQQGPKIPRPNLGESLIPVVGPVWEAVGDIQDGDYAGAAFNGAMAVADALPIGVAAKGIKAATKGIGVLKDGSVTANAARKALKRAGMTKPGEEVHHAIPLKGTPRNVQDWRNHYAFLKRLPKEQHRRLTGSWMGAPRYDPIRQVWYGTTDWMKAIPVGGLGYFADAIEDLAHASNQAPQPPASTSNRR